MAKIVSRNDERVRRHKRIRAKISGTKAVPRLNVYRSNKHIYAQIIDDEKAATIAATSSQFLKIENGSNIAAAELVGKSIGEMAKAKKIKKVVFDRGGYIYHGRVKALAEAARAAGLEF